MITLTKPSDLENALNHLPFTTQKAHRYELIKACFASSSDADQFWQTTHTEAERIKAQNQSDRIAKMQALQKLASR